jgi:hypothetical protein
MDRHRKVFQPQIQIDNPLSYRLWLGIPLVFHSDCWKLTPGADAISQPRSCSGG